MPLPAYRTQPDGPLTEVSHDRAGWIIVTLTYDLPGSETRLHVHRFDHWMTCVSGAARVEIDGEARIVRAGQRYLVEAGKAHGVVPLASNTVLLCEHEIRTANGETMPEAFSPDGIPVEWLQRLTDKWGAL